MNKNTLYYEINEKVLVGDNEQKYISYGIDCFEIDNGFKQLAAQIIDISPNFSKIENLINTLNNLNLSNTHLYDVVEDFICSEN